MNLVRILNKTIVFITHDLDEAIKLGDRIAVMKDGVIAQIGSPEDIIMQPGDDYVAEFVGAISRTKRETARNIMIDGEDWYFSLEEHPVELLNRMRESSRSRARIHPSGPARGRDRSVLAHQHPCKSDTNRPFLS